jgi:hypothetical protein
MEQNYLDLITLLNEQYYNYTKCVDGINDVYVSIVICLNI